MVTAGDPYAALGSSFAAGPGVGERVPGSPRRAGRSSINYAHLVAERLGLPLSDVTFSGATTADILGRSRSGAPAQLDAITPATRLVTITAGGNDVGYLGGLTLASLPRIAAPLVGRRLREARDPAAIDRGFAGLEARLERIVDAIRSRAPGCEILLVDYLTVLPTDESVSTDPLPSGMAEWGRGIAARLSDITGRVAEAEGARFVATGARSLRHDAWAMEPWTSRFRLSLRGGAPYHPTATGMAAVADLVIAQLEAT